MKKIVFTACALSLCASLFAQNYTTTLNVRTVRSEPIYKNIVEEKPIKECWEESVERRSGRGDGGDVVGGVVGGAIGGALGSQVGKGSGKTAATIGGAIVGAMAGQGISREDERGRREVVQKCKTRYETTTRQVLSGYNNYAIYEGKEIIKFSERALESITVYVSVSY